MSYTSTVERKRKRSTKNAEGFANVTTENEFRGQVCHGSLDTIEWGDPMHDGQTDVASRVWTSEEAVVSAATYGSRFAITVRKPSIADTNVSKYGWPEAEVVMTREQLLALRDSINALDI